jgi:hypothetical protein
MTYKYCANRISQRKRSAHAEVPGELGMVAIISEKDRETTRGDDGRETKNRKKGENKKDEKKARSKQKYFPSQERRTPKKGE